MVALLSFLLLFAIGASILAGLGLAVSALRMPRDFPFMRLLGAVHLVGVAASALVLVFGGSS